MRSEEAVMERVSDLQNDSTEKESECWIGSLTGDKKLEDEYLLGNLIGRGASSVVYKCLRKGRTEWACKILKKDRLDRKAVQTEVPTLLKLKHPNLVQIKEVFETKDEIQMVLELAQGGELFERIVERGHYSEEDAAQAVRQILNALMYLHNQGVVHKDLKPENLLYQTESDDSILKLVDFGMSKLLADENLKITKACGTFGYCAPEILLNKEYDSAVDLWSLGVVTYIMLCGFEPFWDEKGDGETYKRIVECDYSYPSPWWDGISDSAKELISKLLSVDPKSRPTAAEALNHPWTLGISTCCLHMNDTIIRLREFNARRRFRVATKAVMATRRALNLLSPSRKTQREDKDDKVEDCKCSCKQIDGRTDWSENNESSSDEKCFDCPPRDSVHNDSYVSVDKSSSSLPLDGSSIGKTSAKLAAEISSKYKESYYGLG